MFKVSGDPMTSRHIVRAFEKLFQLYRARQGDNMYVVFLRPWLGQFETSIVVFVRYTSI